MLYTGDSTHIWGFSKFGQIGVDEDLTLPSPTLTAVVGDSVIVKVVNVSGEGHTIHWHGLDVNQENDGVPHTSDYVLTGDTFIYRFKATHAGNFIYHCHVTTNLHLMMGMYGSFIVHSDQPDEIYPGGPTFDREYDFLGSELDKSLNDDFMSNGSPHSDEHRHFLLNGLQKHQLYEDEKNVVVLNRGDRVLLRLINIGFDVHDYHFPSGIKATVYTGDGRPLPKSFITDNLQLYPGERYSVILETEEENFEGNIVVNYLKMYRLKYAETNHIGINNDSYPVATETLKNEEYSGLKVYPVPARNHINIKNLPPNTYSIDIVSIAGKVFTFPISEDEIIDISGLAPGFYVIKVTGGKNLTGKFIKH